MKEFFSCADPAGWELPDGGSPPERPPVVSFLKNQAEARIILKTREKCELVSKSDVARRAWNSCQALSSDDLVTAIGVDTAENIEGYSEIPPTFILKSKNNEK